MILQAYYFVRELLPINAKDAGSVAGFKAIFTRLGIGIIAFRERENPAEWDVCTIDVTDGSISQNSKLIQTLIEQYGRTCRRYRFQVTYPVKINIRSAEFSYQQQLFFAQDDKQSVITIKPTQIKYQQQVFVASI